MEHGIISVLKECLATRIQECFPNHAGNDPYRVPVLADHHNYVMFTLNWQNTPDVVVASGRLDFVQCVNLLPPDECRFLLFNYEFAGKLKNSELLHLATHAARTTALFALLWLRLVVGRDVARLISKDVFASRVDTRLWQISMRSKLILISWVPDAARLKAKMIYASSKSEFRQYVKIGYEISGTDLYDLNEDCVFERIVG